MLELLFGLLVFVIFGKLFLFGLKMAWGFIQFFVAIVLMPIILFLIFFQVSVYFAWPLLLVIGIIVLIKTMDKKSK